jgi:hypothetical protein
LQALEVQGKALGPRHFRAYDEVVARHFRAYDEVVAKHTTTFWQHRWHYFGNISNSWDVLIVKHEANVIMNLNKHGSQSHKRSKGSYTYSLIMGGILDLIIGVRSLPPTP